MYNNFFEYAEKNQEILLEPKKTDCAACSKAFVEAGGCECIVNRDCDPLALIPEECLGCENMFDPNQEPCKFANL